jgi:hypothetical protein
MFLGDIARAFRGLGSGVAHGIGGLGRRIKRFGEADDLSPAISPGSYSKPPSLASPSSSQNPAATARQGLRGMEDAVADAERFAREDSLAERRNLPIIASPTRGDLPPLTPAPSLAELRSPLPSLPPARRMMPVAKPASAPVATGIEALRPEMDLDRRNLPIPRLPGHAGGPTSYNSTDAAEYDYVMRGAKRDAEGNLTGGFNRDWKQSLLSTALGAARGYATTGDVGGAIGGAAAGGAGSIISPSGGREFVFDTMYRPELESRQAREQAARDRANMDVRRQAELDDVRAGTDERRARTRKLGEPTPRSADPKIGINRRTGNREYFDANDPAQRELYDAYVEPKSQPRGQMRLGRNTRTGEVDYYDPSDPSQAAIFKPDRLPTSEKVERPRGLLSELKKLRESKQNADRLWKKWGETREGAEREKARELAGAAQDSYNQAVADFGDIYGDLYETGQGSGGWAYFKKREGGRTQGAAPPAQSSQSRGQRKAVVGQDFVKHVADTLKVSPERAKQIVIDDGYEVR